KLLDGAKGKDALTEEQHLQVPFFAAKCWFEAGDYKKALEIHEALIVRHRSHPEELDALGGAIQCHAALGQQTRVKQRLLEIEKALPQHDDPIPLAGGVGPQCLLLVLSPLLLWAQSVRPLSAPCFRRPAS